MVFCALGGNDACPVGVTLLDGTFTSSPMRGVSSVGIPEKIDPGVATNLGAVKNEVPGSGCPVLALMAGLINEGGKVVDAGAV